MELMKGYKQTDLGIIPNDWDVVKMSSIGETIIGLTYSPMNVKESGTLVLRSSNVQNMKLAFNDNVYVDMELPDRVIVKENDLLICVRNGSRQLIGKCALIDKKTAGSAFGAFMSIYRSKNNKFIFYQFQSSLIQWQINETLGATINQLTNKDLSVFKIVKPRNIQEEELISKTLSSADAYITCLEKLIQKKKVIKQGVMQELLKPKDGWDWKILGDIGKTFGGLSGKSKDDFKDGITPYIPFMNIMNNPVIDPEFLDYVNIKSGESQNAALKGDLFFNGSSETPEEVGMCSVLLEEIPNLYLNSFCFGFRLKKELKINGLYLAYFFRSKEGRKLFYSMAQGATRYNLSKANFNKLIVPVPKIEEQDLIARTLYDIEADIRAHQDKLNKAKLIKQGMMQNLLTGKIRLL